MLPTNKKAHHFARMVAIDIFVSSVSTLLVGAFFFVVKVGSPILSRDADAKTIDLSSVAAVTKPSMVPRSSGSAVLLSANTFEHDKHRSRTVYHATIPDALRPRHPTLAAADITIA